MCSKWNLKLLQNDYLAIFFPFEVVTSLFLPFCRTSGDLFAMICNKLIFKSIYLLSYRVGKSQNLKQGTLKNFIAGIDLSSPVSFKKFKK